MKKQLFKFKWLLLSIVLSIASVNPVWAGWKVYYGNTTEQVYLHLWNAGEDNTSWGSKKAMSLVPGTTNVWVYEVKQSSSFNCIFCKSQNGDGKFNDKDITVNSNNLKFSSTGTTGTAYTPPTFTVSYNANGGSGSTSSHTGVAYNASVTLRANGFTRSNYTFAGWNTASNGTGTYYAPGASYTVTANRTFYAMWVPTAVLGGTKIMVYGGERVDWNQSTYYFMTTNSTSNPVASPTMSIEKSIDNVNHEFGVATLPAGTYYQGHWASGLSCAVTAGHAYVVRGSGSATYFTQKANSGSNYLYEVIKSGSTSPTYSVTTTLGSSSFAEGTSTLSVSTSGGPGKSVLDKNNSLLYFLYNGSTWSLVQLSAGNLNVSSLTDGSYSLASVLTDGYIYVRADKDDFNVYAVYSITYRDKDDVAYSGDNLASLPTSYNHGTGIASLTDGEKDGYIFNGWFDNSNCTGDPVTSISSSATGNKTFYAKWTSASTYRLTYYANYDATGTSGTAPAAADYAQGSTQTVADENTLAMTNYDFAGWNTEQYITGTHYDAGDDITMSDNINLYAEWTRSIPMDDQGATTGVSTTVYGTYNCTTLTDHTNPAKTGYTFGGWYSEIAGAGSYVISPEHVLQASKNHWTDAGGRFTRYPSSTSSLYAKWTQTVTLKANTDNHGSGTDQTATATWNKTSISIPTHCSAATGYSLDGYYTAATGGTKIINADKSFAGSNITVSGDPYISSGKWVHPGATTLYAQYTPNVRTITFAPDGGTVTPTSASVTYDAAISNAPIPTKTGYNFTGYNTAGGASITTNAGVFKASVDGFTDASAHWVKDANATITAQWTAKTTTVTLDQQSGSGGSGSVTATYGSAMPAATMPTYTGYDFGGYYTGTTGSGTKYYNTNGSSAKNWNFEDATKTLYAKWTAHDYTITYHLNGGTGATNTTYTILSSLITLPTAPTVNKTGYTFGGWYDNSSFTGSAVTSIAAGSTGNKEYWAKWTVKNYDITYDPASAPSGVTYTTTPSNADYGATVNMVFTPSGDNTVIVTVEDESSNEVTVTNPSPNTFRFTMPASAVTVSVSVQSLPIVYVLKSKYSTAYFPDGFTSGGSNTQVKIWAWETSTGGNNNFFTGGAWPGYTAQSRATEYTDAHGNVWWRFIPTNTSYFTRSTPYSLIINYDNGSATSIYESNANDHYVSDGTKRETCNSSTKTTFTGTVWVVPGGTGSHSATLYYENPSSSKKFCFVQGRFKAYTDKSRQTVLYTDPNDGTKWGTNSTNIRMFYDETNSRYYLHTYCTPNELRSISSNNGYIHLTTSIVTSSLTGGSSYYANSDENLTAADTKINFSTTSGSNRPYINNSTTNKYVVLYWDESKLWYEEEPIPAQISSIGLSESKVPPGASITATPNMSVHGTVNQAYCWGVYTDAGCTIPVSGVSFKSLGAGKVQFTVPEAQATYYLKLTVHSSADCESEIDDEEVQSFQVTTSNMVFFNNSATKWSGVYVYFLGDTKYWSDENKGSGCKDRDYGRANQMHRIGKSDIYFYEYSGNSLGVKDVQFIAFTEYGKPDATDFAYTNAAYRADFARGCAPMYVPENWVTDRLNYCEYYNRGYWTTYGVNGVSRNSGFTLKIFDAYDGGSQVASETLSNTDGSNTYRATVNLSNVNYSYGYQLLSCANNYYGNDGVMNAHVSTDWKFEPDKHRCGLDSKAAGAYTFIVQCTDGGEVKVSVEYPLMDGDYRLLYNDTCVYQAHAHPSQFIRQNYSAVNVKLDTVSMYIRPDKQPVLTIQRCTNASSAPPTWANVGTYDVTGLTNGHGVYNFYISQAVSSGALTINGVSPYTGLYYVRTQQLEGGWYSYEGNKDNVLTYTEYAEQKNYGFNYYKAKWVGTTGADVTFTIANDYSESLCDTMVADPENNPLTAAQARSLPHTASVRFGWNSKTNTLHRAYINGSSVVSDRYLVLIGDEKLKDKDGNPLTDAGGGKVSGLGDYEMNFTDLNNWIYRCDVTAVEGAEVKLTAKYDSYTQYFIGGADETEQIIGSTGSAEPEEYVMRVTYDFKTNRLMTAWLPNGSQISKDVELNADMMLIRKGQNAATQVYFNGNKKSISEIHTIFGVMEFQYDTIVGKFPTWSSPNAYKYLMYYISFPFDVKVSEIFGCGVRGENWIIQKYNGAKRAKIGWFAETSTFWETLPGDSTLHAYEGYLLLLDRISFNDGGSKIWENLKSGGSVYLYFPSASKTSGTISDGDKVVTIPSHACSIDRTFTPAGAGGPISHQYTDSHWNVIGTPLFENKTAASIVDGPTESGETMQYYYAWNSADNTLAAQAAFDDGVTFKSMHSYMVQYTGDVTFSGAKLTPPASVAARHIPGEKQNYRIKLRMETENGNRSETFVELRENACDTFALNEDMYMMRSSTTVDLYTYAGNYDVAANVLSMNNHIVPIGMDVKRAGTYRFTMPSDFSGTVTLIDTEADVRTNLAYGDYEVNLPKGTLNNRFLLEINIQQMPTAIDGAGGSLKDGKAHKFIENGQMYILQNGIIYDARGNRVK